MATCSLCGVESSEAVLREAGWASPETRQRLLNEHPDWRMEDGACPACVQQALLELLLERGDEELHQALDLNWPLKADSPNAAIPVPLRMHANPHFHGRGVTLAMVDSAFYPHPDLIEPRNRILAWVDASQHPPVAMWFAPNAKVKWPGWDDRRPIQWHGLMTSVTAAGNGRLSHGLYRGLASEADLVLIQVANERGAITDDAIERALRWLISNASVLNLRVVNLSVVGDSESSQINKAASDLVRRNVVVVAAAGNDGVRRLLPPATCPDAITVGGLDEANSLDHDRRRIWHSNYGEDTIGALKPELVAPSIWVAAPLLPGTKESQVAKRLFNRRMRGHHEVDSRIEARNLVSPYYKLVEGTSFAAPIVASTVACMLEANPSLTPALVRQCLAAACTPVPGAPIEQQGLGAVDSGQAVLFALRTKGGILEGYAPSPEVTRNATVFVLNDSAAQKVEVYGSWNDWRRPGWAAQLLSPGIWKAEGPPLQPGRYTYKFLVDGKWMNDPANPRKTPDGFGGFNSVLVAANRRGLRY